MRADKMTNKFQVALADAQSKALGMDHQFIEPVHLLTAMLDAEGSTVRHLLINAGVDVNKLRSQLGQNIDRIARVEGTGGDVHPSNELVRVLSSEKTLISRANYSWSRR